MSIYKFAAAVLLIQVFTAQSSNAESNWSNCINSAQLDWANSRLVAAEQKIKQSISVADPKNLWQIQWSHCYLGKLYLSELKLPLAQKEFNAALQKSQDGGISDDCKEGLAKAYHLQGNESVAGRWRASVSKANHGREYEPYMAKLSADVKASWKPRGLKTSASTVVAFYLDKMGTAKEIHVASSSGLEEADDLAIETMEAMPAFGKLPIKPEEEPCILFTFDYNYRTKAEGPKTGIRAELGGYVDPSSRAETNIAEKHLKLAETENKLKKELAVLDLQSETPSTLTMQKRGQLLDCLIEEKKFLLAQKIATQIFACYERGRPEDLIAAHAWQQSGEIANTEGKFEQARDCYKKSLEISQRIGPEGSPQEQQSMLAYAKCLYRLGDTEAAKVLYERLKDYKAKNHK